jgi:hypothetical protein
VTIRQASLPFFFASMMAVIGQAATAIDIGSRLEPLVDDYLIETTKGAALTLHKPVCREVVIVHDKPWEGSTCAYHTVFQDGDRYRMYYRGSHFDAKMRKATHPEVVCYAESKDGIHWTKPVLGLFEFDGSKDNNIVWRGPQSHNFAPFLDANPKCAPEQRYKALALGKGGLQAFQSHDGIHWRLLQTEPVITKGAFDSQNLAFWDSARQCYVEYHREFRDGARDIMMSTSPDFVHWTSPRFLEFPGVEREELYTNQIAPYARAPHLLFGFPMRYVASRSSPFAPNTSRGMNGVTDGVFMTSRDGQCFRRWTEALIRPGLQPDRWVTRNNMTAWGIVRTKSDVTGAPDELSIYSTEGYYQGDACRLRRFTVRMDGFVSLHADGNGGEMVTRPLTFRGTSLQINFSTSAAGFVRVEIQDDAGKPIPGFSLNDCPDIYGDRIEQVVGWKQGGDVSKLAGQSIRLRFVLKDADVYAIRFQ